MAEPSVEEATNELRKAAEHIFRNDRDTFTVNSVRKAAAEELNVDLDFFKSAQWKDKSKDIIKACSDALQANEPESAEPTPVKKKEKAPAPKNTKKRVSTSQKSAPKKRQKKEETPPSNDEATPSEVESVASEVPEKKKGKKASNVSRKQSKQFSDSEGDVGSKKEDSGIKRKGGQKGIKGKSGSRVQSSADLSEDENPRDKRSISKTKKHESESELSNIPDEKPVSKPEQSLQAEVKEREDSESELSDVKDGDIEPKQSKSPAAKKAEEDESEMSDVLDEEPKPKRKRKSKSEMESSKSEPKSAKTKTKTKAKSATADLSPDEAEIKMLQSHLVQCGIKKIWGIYLKQFGDNNKAKIKHLREMLKDAGLTGRFSREKAAEIKEARELAADLEAVKEGEQKWGLGGGRRSRSAVKSGKSNIQVVIDAEGGDDSNESGDDADSDGEEKGDGAGGRSRSGSLAARRNADLAFLGSEDEDSD